MDRLTGFAFPGTFHELMVKGIASDVYYSASVGDFAEKTENCLPWMPFSVTAVVAKQKKTWKGEFRIKQDDTMGGWIAETKFDIRGFSGNRFNQLLANEGDLIADTLLEFCTLEAA